MSKHGLRIMRTVSQRSFAQEVPVTRRQVLRQNTKMSIHCHEVLTIHGQQFPSSPPSSHIITIPGLERRLSCPSYRVALKPPSTREVNRVNNRVASYIIDIPTLLAIMYQIGKGCSTPDILNHVWSGECHGISTSNSPMVVPLIFRLSPDNSPTFPRRTKKSDSLGCVVSGGRKRCKPRTVAPLRQPWCCYMVTWIPSISPNVSIYTSTMDPMG